jgi:DNA repair exonuclease SbcCD ATPase subunit
VTTPAANLTLDELTREIERAEAADVKHLQARRVELEKELHERSLEESAQRKHAAQNLKRAHAELDPLYTPLVEAIEAYVTAAEAVSTARARYTLALHRARSREVPAMPPPIPRLAQRASHDRDLLKVLQKFRAYAGSDF